MAALASAPARAQESSTAPEARSGAQPVDEIVVRGRRLAEIDDDLRIYIQDFLEEVAAPARSRGYARWHRRVCVGVHNLEADAAQYIVDRISRLALDAGLEPGEPGCRPQVSIIFTTDAAGLSARLVEREPRVFRPVAGNAGTDLGRDALERFVKSDRAVRWWHVSLPVSAINRAAAIETPHTTCPAARCPPTIAVSGPSRVHSGVVDELQYVIIIVDPTKLIGTTWQQIADYLAVVSLAQIDLQAHPAQFDSILNLFSNPKAYSGLTDWDRSFIRAVYEFNQERVPRVQDNEIVSQMMRREVAGNE
jgi:hypothetical protein